MYLGASDLVFNPPLMQAHNSRVFWFSPLQIQSFASRLARARVLKTMSMPPWYKPAVHDAHLLLASSIYGEPLSHPRLVAYLGQTAARSMIV